MGTVSEYTISENNQRHFYKEWSRLMSGRSWPELQKEA
jgi:hypothetical protein